MADIYAVTNVPPEVLAYGLAKYSRSSKSLRENLRDLSEDSAAKFLNTFYFNYGHASIADLAHVALAVENISLLAAIEIVDEPLWDGQERSTRYQNFDGAPYYRPPDAGLEFDQAVHTLFDAYAHVLAESQYLLRTQYPRPEEMGVKSYDRILQARALDVARYCLPLGTFTSLGQITNARTLEQQIRRMLGSSLEEVRNIGRQMKAAIATQSPYDLLSAKRTDIPSASPVLPTLVKYTEPDPSSEKLQRTLEPLALRVPAAWDCGPVELFGYEDPLDSQIAQLLFPYGYAPYRKYLEFASGLDRAQKIEILESVFALRNSHSEWPRALRQMPVMFEMVMDMGAFRDFNRHRRVLKFTQRLDPRLSYAMPSPLLETNAHTWLKAELNAYYARLGEYGHTESLPYLLPLAHKRRVLMAMDMAEAAYIIELRSRSQGHFSYRQLAWEMYEAVSRKFPEYARHIRVTPPEEFNPFQR